LKKRPIFAKKSRHAMIKPDNILDTPIEFLKGIGPVKAMTLKNELSIFVFRDLLYHFPFRYIDRTRFHRIADIDDESDTVQVKGILRKVETLGEGMKKRLVAKIRDNEGYSIDLVWFKGMQWVEKGLTVGTEYIVFGKVNIYNDFINIPHPEIEPATEANATVAEALSPVYPTTEKLTAKGLDPKGIRTAIRTLLNALKVSDIPEFLPNYIKSKMSFPSSYDALNYVHFPKNQTELDAGRNRLKFEELFFMQLRLLQLKKQREQNIKGFVFAKIGDFFNRFYKEKLPFSLTNAQKRVIKEIRTDLGAGIQMNRLLQGDVGSGKTVVALLNMLIALDNGFQASLMAPTELLAQQHFLSISAMVEGLGINVDFLSGSIKGKKRAALLEKLASGEIHILIGTHALIEEPVQFQNLGLAITDEQHRFGVEQRAKLRKKSQTLPPHVLVMSATPIPRTLAMTSYGDLDVSVIDELPPGRKPIATVHKTEHHRLWMIGFMKEEIAKGRQIYVVYPLIEESEKLDLKNLYDGHEALSREFPQPEFQISIVHGRMKSAEKDFEMQRFVKQETQIMVATTVIEVGVNVPNASVMIIENTERFGLSQLHQLRGRVGRGAEQSYCILMSDIKLTTESRERIRTMCSTNDGFKISEADLTLRGPGNIEGTQQSGMLHFHIADLSKDGAILATARELAARILERDVELTHPENAPLRSYFEKVGKRFREWSLVG
jgi:ATP-dependent DNA helicase RecG